MKLSYPVGRDIYFDNIKGKLILLVVLGHCLEFYPSCNLCLFVYVVLYSFVMPCFAFVSGLFFKQKFKTIIRYLLIYLFAQLLFLMCAVHSFAEISVIQFLTPRWTLWYLLCLFYWYTLSNLLILCKCSMRAMVWFAVILCIISGFLKIGYFLSLQRASAYFFFFALGMYIQRPACYKFINTINKRYLIRCCLVGVFILACIYQASFFPKAFYNSYPYFSFWPWSSSSILAVRILQFILSVIFSLFLFQHTSSQKNFYTWCGYYSLWIYILHALLLMQLHS